MTDQQNQPMPENPETTAARPDDDDVWLEDRKALPGETFYGGRGVAFPIRSMPPQEVRTEEDDSYRFDVYPVRLVADDLPCMLVVAEQPTGFKRKRLSEQIWDLVLRVTDRGTLARGTTADRLNAILQGGVDVRPTDAPLYAVLGGDKAAEYGCHEDQVIQFLDMDCLERSYQNVPATTPAAELEAIKKTFPYLDEAVGGDSLWLTRFVPDGNPARAVYESGYGYYVPGDARRALRCVLLLSDDFDRGVSLMDNAVKRAGLKRVGRATP